MFMPDVDDWRCRHRFPEFPETVDGDISPGLVEFLLRVHPDLPYSSAVTALICRQAYDLGRLDERNGATQPPAPSAANDTQNC